MTWCLPCSSHKTGRQVSPAVPVSLSFSGQGAPHVRSCEHVWGPHVSSRCRPASPGTGCAAAVLGADVDRRSAGPVSTISAPDCLHPMAS